MHNAWDIAIRKCTSVSVCVVTNMLHSWHSKICPNHLATYSSLSFYLLRLSLSTVVVNSRDWPGNYCFQKCPKNSLVIITALKSRHRSIRTMLTMPKTYSNIWKTIKLHDYKILLNGIFICLLAHLFTENNVCYVSPKPLGIIASILSQVISVCTNFSCSDKDFCSAPLWLLSSTMLGFLLCKSVNFWWLLSV